jgi:intermediate cleaving peptidase 55
MPSAGWAPFKTPPPRRVVASWSRLAARSYATISASDLQFGQPVHETHPHILKAGESMSAPY